MKHTLAEGIFYQYNTDHKLKCSVSRDGTLYPDDSDAAFSILEDPFSNEVVLFESQGKRYFVFPDHTKPHCSFLVNMPGVEYKQEMKKIAVDTALHFGKILDMNSTDKEFVDYIDFFFVKMLQESNHPSKDMMR